MPNVIEVGIAGVTFEGRQDVLRRMYQAQEDGAALSGRLSREPDNPYDPNAVRVYIGEMHVGYIPKALAAKLAARIDAGEAVTVARAHIIRGGDPDRITYGARIHIEMPIKEAV